MSSTPAPLKIRRVRCDAQASSSSLDHGLKLRGPSPSLACSLILAELSYGERQVPVNTKRASLKDSVSVVQDCLFGGGAMGSRTDLHVQIATMAGQIYRDVIPEKHVRLFQGPWSQNLCLWMATPVLTMHTS
ncbi:hypothetical protein TNCV_387871 [Trichonephila clavipes]|nr:hypothetical protein TNCV_387871 [Trichonephila clavipes]